MERYCFELERVSRDRDEGVDAPIYDGVWLTRRHGRETHRACYVVYDRQRGLYNPFCFVSNAADAQRIVDALNAG